MGAGNTSVLMQLLVGMLDAALARQQDLVPAERRVAVALKVDEAPLVLNRGFAETMALKRSAGLETVACWQTDAQWTDRAVRDQLEALFAHRVYFATASAEEARAASRLMMAQFSDTVRPGIAHLTQLAHPDVRLHLPRHHVIASWTTPGGRQAPFVAQTIPLHVDRERIALHAARQRERGGRHLADLRQPHWTGESERPASARSRVDPGEAPLTPSIHMAPAPTRPGDVSGPAAPSDARVPADSYAELVALDAAHSVRWATSAQVPRLLEPDRLDGEILSLVAGLGHILSSQLHRRFNPTRSPTTTQRRLKRLADAGLLERFQFYRGDGGAVPMCHVITSRGEELLAGTEKASAARDLQDASPAQRARPRGERALRQARHEVHVTGWVLSLSALLGHARCVSRGGDAAVLSPPARATSEGSRALGPADLRLPTGRVAHDFTRTDLAGRRIEVERFETVRPDAIVEVARVSNDAAGRDDLVAAPGAIDVLVELDDCRPWARGLAKLERYDHFLAGWSAALNRYGRRSEARALVVFVCRGAARARELARAADGVLRACRAYAGEYPYDWEYPGRRQILFASERDVHEGLLRAYGVPALPPRVRVVAAHGDPHAGEAQVDARELRL
jgi:protein involved in plasmid replication-relaxation